MSRSLFATAAAVFLSRAIIFTPAFSCVYDMPDALPPRATRFAALPLLFFL